MRRYLLESAPVLAIHLDADYRVVDINGLARAFLRSEAIGRPFADQVVDFGHSLDLGSLIARSDETHRLSLSSSSGNPETLSFRFFPLPAGTLALGSLDFQEQQRLRDEVVGLNHDLNDLTRQLHQANAELRELNELKNRFIGMAAHDLRKPIGVIMTYSEFLLDEASERLNEKERGFLRTNIQAATGMKRLIDNFLDVSIIESGQLRLELSSTDASKIVGGALPLVRLVAAKKKVELITEYVDEAPLTSVDFSKIQQVLVNLASNAIEHSRAGQRVWLNVQREGEELLFSVRDEGPGIEPEDQKKLFAPFMRAGTRKTAGERSIGLGLAIARLVIEAHGGRIWVQSMPGTGATFLFSIPVRAGSRAKERISL
ncbi:MAG: ATP-binding protein [Spirochaetota bacterium]